MPSSTAPRSFIVKPARRPPQPSSCCTAFRRRRTCSATSFRPWPTATTWSHPTCRASDSPTAPDRKQFRYTFEHLAKVIDAFTQTIGLERYAIYVFDYGAPVGFRLALAHPERVTAIISQNGNAYEEGLSQGWNPIQKYWKEPTSDNRAALRDFLTPETTKFQYLHGVQDETLVAPEAYQLDSALLARPGNDEIQLDLFLDYASNVALYPKFQEYFRTKRPPLLAVWGKNDPFFLPPGAEAFKRDNPERRSTLLRHRSLRAGNASSGDCRRHSGVPQSQASNADQRCVKT